MYCQDEIENGNSIAVDKPKSPIGQEEKRDMSKQVQKNDGAVKVRKSTKGIPRITDKVLAGGDALAKYNDAVSKLSPAVQAECKARLAKAQNDGPKVKKIDFSTIFAGRSVEDLTVAQTALTAALADAAVTAEQIAEQELAAVQAKLAALKDARKAIASKAPAIA